MKRPPPRTLADSLLILSELSHAGPITLQTIIDTLAGRGYHLIIAILSLPFCLPIQIPGMSTPFGLIIAFLGIRFTYEHKILLPKRFLEKEISPTLFAKILQKSEWLITKMQKISKPRILWLSKNALCYRLHGVTTAILGLLLALPLPIPLTNIVASMGLLLLHFGLTEDDGVFILAGYFFALITIAFFAAILLYINTMT
jgi:hypothetical protein